MIVYGDPAFSVSAEEAIAAIASFGKAAASGGCDPLRDLVIACGQFEQALADLGEPAGELTDRAAEAFVAALCKKPQSLVFSTDSTTATGSLKVKVPEGFAFYTVYPEQYVRATEAWLDEARGRGPVLVAGIRSIGTSLSAIVAARLRLASVAAARRTLRPGGHPFDRRAQIDADCTRYSQAIVVDEGPGLSGSSMAAVVRALREVGIADVAIFPSHRGSPGNAASASVLELWRNARRYVFPVIGNGGLERPLQRELASKTQEHLGCNVRDCADLSAGAWRNLLEAGHEITAAPPLERTKLLIRGEDGRALLWKFAGLGCGPDFKLLAHEARARQQRLSDLGWCAPPVVAHGGFIATEWVNGERGDSRDLDAATVQELARYIRESAKPPLSSDACTASAERLRQIVCSNIEEALGSELATRAGDLLERAPLATELPSYGDGRMAPHEWIRHNGRLIKTDVWGHDCDHTAAGPQPVLWDVAGALVDWEMPERARSAFLDALRWRFSAGQLNASELGYCSFRLGVASMFGPAAERDRMLGRIRYLLR